MVATLEYEQKFWNQGKTVIGFDEAGRGPIAGDMYYALVQLHQNVQLPFDLKDSKKYSDRKRFELEKQVAPYIAKKKLGSVRVNQINTGANLNDLMYASIVHAIFSWAPEFILLVDGNQYIRHIPREAQFVKPKLDELSVSCAIASILAKNAQVRAMIELDKSYPGYGFVLHKGYGTEKHYDAIKKFGLCEAHREKWIKK